MLTILLPNFIIVLLYITTWYFIALKIKDNGIADVAWGGGFITLSIINFFYWLYNTNNINNTPNILIKKLLLLTLILIWGIRLSAHIYARNKHRKTEDFRYKKWREEWGNNWKWQTFWKVFMLQGLFMNIIALPLIFFFSQNISPHWSSIEFWGIILFLLGFYFEAVADWQLLQFKKNKDNANKIMTLGLWKHSRHPNYFGEILIWWGIYLSCYCAPYSWLCIISPITISWLIVNVSGVPMLEKKYSSNPDYNLYKQNTPALVPFLNIFFKPRKNKE